MPGVFAYMVDLRTNSATVLFDPTRADVPDLQEAVRLAGFRVRSVRELSE